MATTSNEAAIRAAVTAIIALCPMDKIIGHPNHTSWSLLKQQCAQACSKVKTSKWGGATGHLALVLNEIEFRTATGIATAVVDRQDQPPVIPTNLANNATLVARTRIGNVHRQDKDEYWTQEAVDAAVVERIVTELIDKVYVEELENQYTGFTNQSIKTMLAHIRKEWCVITTLEKATATNNFKVQWDFVTHITKYARDLDKLQLICTDLKAEASDETKIETYVLSMYACDMFDDKEMQEWENKDLADQTWTDAKTYFVKLWKMKSRHTAEREARREGFESTNSVNGRSVVSGTSYKTAETGVPESIMTKADQSTMVEYCNSLEGSLVEAKETVASLQTTNDKLIERMDTSQNEMMQKMMKQQSEFMKMMLANAKGGGGGNSEKEKDRGGRTERAKRLCKHCKKEGYHEDDDCFELEKNKEKRPKWWKSVKE